MAEIKTIAVLGAGTMGHGIAQVAAQAGYQAFLYDVSRDLAEKGVRKISENLKLGVDKGKVRPEERDAALARINPVDDLEAVSRCDLLIEAIPEDLSLKRGLFKQLSEICASTTILASNTSSLSLTDIAAAARGPERVVGMHFFNPVHLMKLLEIGRALPPRGSELRSDCRRSACSKRGSRAPRTSTGRWSWATGIRWVRSSSRIWLDWTSDLRLPSTSTKSWVAMLFGLPSCSNRWSGLANWAARPARVSTNIPRPAAELGGSDPFSPNRRGRQLTDFTSESGLFLEIRSRDRISGGPLRKNQPAWAPALDGRRVRLGNLRLLPWLR